MTRRTRQTVLIWAGLLIFLFHPSIIQAIFGTP